MVVSKDVLRALSRFILFFTSLARASAVTQLKFFRASFTVFASKCICRLKKVKLLHIVS